MIPEIYRFAFLPYFACCCRKLAEFKHKRTKNIYIYEVYVYYVYHIRSTYSLFSQLFSAPVTQPALRHLKKPYKTHESSGSHAEKEEKQQKMSTFLLRKKVLRMGLKNTTMDLLAACCVAHKPQHVLSALPIVTPCKSLVTYLLLAECCVENKYGSPVVEFTREIYFCKLMGWNFVRGLLIENHQDQRPPFPALPYYPYFSVLSARPLT